MRVLVACEFSGVVRDAFIRKGHLAVSCDLLDTEADGPHLRGDVRNALTNYWDLMIAHPPCTALCVSGNRYYASSQARADAIEFFRMFLDAPIEKICVENPVGVISTAIRKPDQYIQPYDFGHNASKKTGLWLKNLPKLQLGKYIAPRWVHGIGPRWANQTDSGQNRLGPSPERSMERSRTYQGIADAMAEQWG